jgi:molecular chaperone HtpG
MDDCEALLPECLRFMKGVVDSEDLPLNVSREMLQEEEMVKKLRKILVKRILDHLNKLATSEEEKDKETFKAIESQFGAVLREGLLHEFEHKERLLDIARWPSTAGDEKTGLEDYVKRMKEGQDAIYCLTGVNLESAKTSPALEGHLKKGYEVLLMCDPVDDYCLQNHCLEDYKGKKIVHVGRGDADFMDDEAKKALEAKKADYQDLLSLCKDAIPEEVSEARLSGRLTDSPCCIVSDAHGMSRSMEDVMRQMGRPMPKQKRILELNPDHPLIQRLNTLRATQADDVKECVHILHDQAILADGGRLEDGPGFAKRVQKMLEKLVAK